MVRWLVLVAACGQPLVDETYRGAPIWSLETRIEGEPTDGDVRVAIFWNTHEDEYEEDPASSRSVTVGERFTLNVFAPPSARLEPLAVGRIMAYIDADGDGRRDNREPFAGALMPRALFWASRDLEASESLTANPLPAGYHLLNLPQRCDLTPPPATDAATCGVPIGEHCIDDDGCGPSGTCLRETISPWSGGYCTIVERNDRPLLCRPDDAVYYQRPRRGPIHPATVAYYLQSCTSDADCVRPGEGPYECDVGLRACFPISGNFLSLDANPMLEPLCMQSIQ